MGRRPGVELRRGGFALLVIDPQVDFLSPEGVTWGVVLGSNSGVAASPCS